MVTGSGGERGFGRAIARRLAADGADLVLTDIAPAGVRVVAAKRATGWRGLEAVADEVRAAGRRAVVAQVDVRAADQVQRAIDLADRTFGRIDILVNNAAAPPGADRVPVVELPEEAWHVILETNLTGTYLCSKAAAGLMVARGTPGRIINMSSNCGKVGYRAAGRVLRLQVRRDRVHPGSRHGAGAPPHHGERDLPGLGRHRSARLPRPAPRRELRRGAPGGGDRRAVRPDSASARGHGRGRGGAGRVSRPRTPPATSPGRRSTWRAAPSCTDGAGCRQVPPSSEGSPLEPPSQRSA